MRKIFKIGKVLSAFCLIIFALSLFIQHAKCDGTAASNPEIADMQERQKDVSDSYDLIKKRVDSTNPALPRRTEADKAVSAAEGPINDFKNLDPNTAIDTVTGNVKEDFIADFEQKEKAAKTALNDINTILIAPDRPGNVYKGDLTQDFIPSLIGIAFKFASLAIFVAFVVSGVMFVMAFGEEGRTTKAKHILYYTLIGFACVVLAYAIVKAITDINYFGIV